MSSKGFEVRLSARVDAYVAALKRAEAETNSFSKSTEANMKRVGTQMRDVGSKMTRSVTLPLVALGAGAVTASVQWESAWAGVTKTVDGTAEQLERLESDLRDMASELPATHGEIAAVAEAAGQLGVAVDDVADFSRVMLDLGETTNLSANEAATQLARFMNIMGSAADDVDNIGSAVVGLGNNFATTEAEIVEMGMRLAGAGRQMGLTEGDVLGLATAMSSVGIEAEAGGTAMTLTMKRIQKEVETSGDQLDTFAQIAGMTSAQFRQAWETDASSALAAFVTGLSNTEAMGMSTTAVLTELGITGVREADALLRLAGAGDVLTGALAMGNEEFAKSTALSDEAAKRYETTGARLEMLRNRAYDVAITFGDQMVPALEFGMNMAGGAVDAFAAMPGPLRAITIGVGALVAGMGPLLFVGGSLVKNFTAIRTAIHAYNSSALGARVSTRTLTAAMTGVGIAVAAATVIYGDYARRKAEAKQRTEEFTAALEAEASGQADAIDALVARNLAEYADQFDALGISAVDAARYIKGESVPAIQEMMDVVDGRAGDWHAMKVAMQDLGLEGNVKDFGAVTSAIQQNRDAVIAANRVYDATEATLGGLGTQTEETAESIDWGTLAVQGMVAAVSAIPPAAADASEAVRTFADRIADATEEHRKLVDQLLAGIDNSFDYEERTLNLANAYGRYTEAMAAHEAVMADSTATDNEKATSLRELRIEEIGLAKDAYATAEAYADQQGAAEGSRTWIELMTDSLAASAEQYPELRDEIDAYIDELNRIPTAIHTGATITFEVQGRKVTVNTSSDGGTVTVSGRRATGGPTAAGRMYEVLERGESEVLTENGRHYLMSARDGQVTPLTKHDAMTGGLDLDRLADRLLAGIAAGPKISGNLVNIERVIDNTGRAVPNTFRAAEAHMSLLGV